MTTQQNDNIESRCSILSLPLELLHIILSDIPSECDRQSLRYSCASFRSCLPPPILRPSLPRYMDPRRPKQIPPYWKHHYPASWHNPREQKEFLKKLIVDSKEEDLYSVCPYCVQIKEKRGFKFISGPPSGSACWDCWERTFRDRSAVLELGWYSKILEGDYYYFM